MPSREFKKMLRNKVTADARQMALNILASNGKTGGDPKHFFQKDSIILIKQNRYNLKVTTVQNPTH